MSLAAQRQRDDCRPTPSVGSRQPGRVSFLYASVRKLSLTNRIPALLCASVCTILSNAHAVEFEINENSSFFVFGAFQYLYLLEEQRLVADPDGSLIEPEEIIQVDPCLPPCNSGDEVFKAVNELVDNGSLVGVAGEYTLDNGLDAYFLTEWGFAADETPGEDGGLSLTLDSYIGLSGDFGTLQLGNSDGIYSNTIDVVDNFEYEGVTEYSFTALAGDLLSYEWPGFKGFSFAVQTSLKGDGAGIDNDPAVPPATEPYPADDIYPAVVTVSYVADLFSVRLGFDNRKLVHKDARPQVGLAATLDLEPFSFGAKLESIGESRNNANDGIELAGLLATFDYEVGTVSVAVQQITFDTEVPNSVIDFDTSISDLRKNRTEAVLHANYKLSDNIGFYFETAVYGAVQDLGDYTGLGTNFEF